MKQRTLPHLALVCGLSLTLLASGAQAARHHWHQQRQKTPSAAQQQIQAEGIVGGVVDQLWLQTDRYWHAGDYPRIVALDRIITQADPTFLEAYSTGGWLMDSLGRTQDAEAFYTLGTRANPRSSYAYWNLGMFYFGSTHDYPNAIVALLKDTEQSGAAINDWKMLAHSYEKAGQWDNAVTIWREIHARWPQGMGVDRLLREAEEKRDKAQQPEQVRPDNGKPAQP